MKIGFYILGKKGYFSLERFVREIGSAHIAFVIAARDSGVENDWHNEIADLCVKYEIKFNTRGEEIGRAHV